VRRAAEQAQASTSQPTATAAARDVEPLRGIRRVVAERMAHSFATAPHFYLTAQVEATALLHMRAELVADVEAATGVRLTITDFLVKAVAMALHEFPEVNAAWVEGSGQGAAGLRDHTQVNVGIAVGTDEGLVVPVIHQADELTLGEIARRRAELSQRARNGKLALEQLEGGTFTLTNLGMFGVDQFQAIINPPQGAILAVGRIKERPVVVAGTLAVRPTMYVTLSADHRVLDGVQGARFLERVARYIEEPDLLIAQ
jgi:pyruvate dehydrogenase E2 component (dihydrolipoamide acetyltransferase)